MYANWALGNAVTPIHNKTGGALANDPGVVIDPRSGGPSAFPMPVARGIAPGPAPLDGPPYSFRFIPPLDLFNSALHWVQSLALVPQLALIGAASSNPPLPQYKTIHQPMQVVGLASGTQNLQLTLGGMMIQGEQLTIDESNYFG